MLKTIIIIRRIFDLIYKAEYLKLGLKNCRLPEKHICKIRNIFLKIFRYNVFNALFDKSYHLIHLAMILKHINTMNDFHDSNIFKKWKDLLDKNNYNRKEITFLLRVNLILYLYILAKWMRLL